jgi:ankyrin repeat protein
MNFNLLCEELGINTNQAHSQKLGLLQQWFQKTISRDLQITRDENEQYAQYQEAIETYFEYILPETKGDITKSNPQFDNESLLTALASMGFDQVLLSLKPDAALLNTPNINGLTPLHLAALAGHIHTTQALLDLGEEAGILNKQQQYPLFSALMLPMLHDEELKQNKIVLFRLLRDKGAQPLNHQDTSGNTVLHQMALHDFGVLIEELLTSNLALAYIKNNHTHYPIHTAILNNQLQNVRLLLNIKDGATLADNHGWVALHYAARYGDKAILEECCKVNTNVDILDHDGRTPLMLAVEQGHISEVQDLIAHGAQTNLTDAHGATILHHAVRSGSLEMVRWLMNNTKINSNVKDDQNKTPLQISQERKMSEISTFLLENGATANSG